MAPIEYELAIEVRGYFYAREATASTQYTKGACYLAAGDRDAAAAPSVDAWRGCLATRCRTSGPPSLDGEPGSVASAADAPESVDQAVARAARLARANRVSDAVLFVSSALTAAASGIGGWRLAVAPLLRVSRAPESWAPVLAVVHLRAHGLHLLQRTLDSPQRSLNLPQRPSDSPERMWGSASAVVDTRLSTRWTHWSSSDDLPQCPTDSPPDVADSPPHPWCITFAHVRPASAVVVHHRSDGGDLPQRRGSALQH